MRKERERLERIKLKAEEEADRQWREQRRKEYEALPEDQRWDAARAPTRQRPAAPPAAPHGSTRGSTRTCLTPWPCLVHRPKPMAGKQQIVTRREKQGHRTAKTGAKAHKPAEDNVRKPPAHQPPPAHEPPPVHQPPPAHFRAVRGHACTLRRPASRWLVARTESQRHQAQEERARALMDRGDPWELWRATKAE